MGKFDYATRKTKKRWRVVWRAKKISVFLGLRQLLIRERVVLLAVFNAKTIGFAC